MLVTGIVDFSIAVVNYIRKYKQKSVVTPLSLCLVTEWERGREVETSSI